MVADLRMASPAAVELVNPKHRNERKYRMALITSYNVPGLYVEDHSIDVPLDWRGLEPMLLAVGSTMRRRAREHQALLPRGLRARPHQRRSAAAPVFAGRPWWREPASALTHERRLDRGGRQTLPRGPSRPARHGAQQLCRRAYDRGSGRARDGGRLRCRTLAGGLPQAPPRQLHRARF